MTEHIKLLEAHLQKAIDNDWFQHAVILMDRIDVLKAENGL